MAGDPHARLREVLGVGPGVILSEDEIAKGLSLLPRREAAEIRDQLAKPAAPQGARYAFGGIKR